ncbi:hypothetical protein NCC49_004334 [Naganishia albida]|nr:hypothetical protein NCC49_004334 [Naganishia albida]
MDHDHDHLQHLHYHRHTQYDDTDDTLEQFVNLDGGHDAHSYDLAEERPEDANAPIELLLNAIRNSPTPLSAESDHYSQVADSLNHSTIHSPRPDVDGADYPHHGSALAQDRRPDEDGTNYHAVPEQSDMHVYTESYSDVHPAAPSQDETGEYVIDAAYPDSRPAEQVQDGAFRPVPLRVEGEEYLHSHALETGAGAEGATYEGEYARQEQETRTTYVDANDQEKETAGQEDARGDGGLKRQERSSTTAANPATSRRRTHSLRMASARTMPTELERALQTLAAPETRQDQAAEPRATRTSAADAGPSRPAHSFPQVVPQKRKARQHASPDPTRIPTSSDRVPIGRNSSAPLLNGTPHAPPPARRAATPPFLEEMRRTKISRMFAATTGPGGSRIPEQQMSFSTITLLHGHIVQKSYLKEKRFLCPPPVVRMAGAVSDTVETISLQILNQDVGPDIPIISNNQGVKFNVPGREEGARAYLREGLYFSGLYASRTGKAKSLKLRLNVFQPGGTEPRPPDGMHADEERAVSSERELGEDDQRHVETIQAGNQDIEAIRRQRNMHSLLLNVGRDEGSMDPEERQAAIDAIIENDPMFNMSAEFAGAGQHSRGYQDGRELDPAREMSLMDVAGLTDSTGKEGNEKDKHAKASNRDSLESPAEGEVDPAGQSGKVIEEMEGIGEQSHLRPWATFDGLPMQIVSKPTQSKRPNFAFKRTNASYLYVGDPISLWSRINSQSVRTKYLYVEHGKLVGMPSDWSAFVIDVVKRGEPPGGLPEKNRPDPGIITFNSTVILRDIHSDYRTEPLLLIKVMSGKPVLNEFGPVSELNKVAFAKVVADQGKWYLRAPGHDRDKLEDENGKPLPRVRKRIRGKKDTVNSVVKKRVAPALDTEDNYNGDPSAVRFEPSKLSIEVVAGQSVEGEYFDDFITWTISGVTEHTYTFFEGRHEVGDYSTVFRRPLTPMPILLDIPEYRAMENTITMTVTNFYYDDDNPAYRGKPLLLYLGAIGPLKFRSYRSTAPAAPANANDAGASYLNSFPAIPIDGGEEVPPEARPYSSVPSTVPHTIIVIHLPAPKEMWDATRIERERQHQLEQLQLAHEAKHRQEDVVDDSFVEPAWSPLEEDDRKLRHYRQPETNSNDKNNAEMGIGYDQGKVQPLGEGFMQRDKSVGGDAHLGHHPAAEHSLSSMEMAHDAHHSHNGADDSMADLRVEDFPPFGPEEMGLEDSTSAVMDAMMHSHHGEQEPVDSLLEHQLHEFDHNVSDDMHQLFTAAALQAATQTGQDLLDSSGMLGGDSGHLDHQHVDEGAIEHNAQYEYYTHGEHEPQVETMHDGRAADPDRYSVRHDSLSTLTEADSVLHAVDHRMDEPGDGAVTPGELATMSRHEATPGAPGKKSKVSTNGQSKAEPTARPVRAKPARKPRTPQIKPTLTSTAMHGLTAPPVRITRKPFTACPLYAQGHVTRSSQLGGSSLPLLFLRQSDGTGYHTGKNVVIQKLYAGSDSETWNISIV